LQRALVVCLKFQNKMSKSSGKKSAGASDGTKFSSATKKLLIRKDADIHSVLEQFRKEHTEAGRIRMEVTLEERVVHDLPILGSQPHENSDQKAARKSQNNANQSENKRRNIIRDTLIAELSNCLPQSALDWFERNHSDVMDNSRLNEFCRLIPASLISDDSRTMHDKRIDAEKKRTQNREFKIRSKDQAGKKVQFGRQVLSYYSMLGIEITEQDIVDDSIDSLAGNLNEISQAYWQQRRKFETQSVGKTPAVVARLRTKLLGELPTTLSEFETYVRNYVLRSSNDDIRSYQASFLTTTMSEMKSQIIRELRGDSETLFVTEKETKRPKYDVKSKKSFSSEFPPWMKDKVCKECNQIGHVKTVCPSQKCKLCHKQGHSANFCPRLSDAAKALDEEA
jgi:hypothetical protein